MTRKQNNWINCQETDIQAKMQITVAINISCMPDIAYLDGWGNQREVLACSGETLQSVDSDRISKINHSTEKEEVYSLSVKIIFRLDILGKILPTLYINEWKHFS